MPPYPSEEQEGLSEDLANIFNKTITVGDAVARATYEVKYIKDSIVYTTRMLSTQKTEDITVTRVPALSYAVCANILVDEGLPVNAAMRIAGDATKKLPKLFIDGTEVAIEDLAFSKGKIHSTLFEVFFKALAFGYSVIYLDDNLSDSEDELELGTPLDPNAKIRGFTVLTASELRPYTWSMKQPLKIGRAHV